MAPRLVRKNSVGISTSGVSDIFQKPNAFRSSALRGFVNNVSVLISLARRGANVFVAVTLEVEMDDDVNDLIGAMIRARRVELGISQADLAEELGVSRKKISNSENGKFGSVSGLLEITQALGLVLIAAPRELRETRELKYTVTQQTSGITGKRVKKLEHWTST